MAKQAPKRDNPHMYIALEGESIQVPSVVHGLSLIKLMPSMDVNINGDNILMVAIPLFNFGSIDCIFSCTIVHLIPANTLDIKHKMKPIVSN